MSIFWLPVARFVKLAPPSTHRALEYVSNLDIQLRWVHRGGLLCKFCWHLSISLRWYSMVQRHRVRLQLVVWEPFVNPIIVLSVRWNLKVETKTFFWELSMRFVETPESFLVINESFKRAEEGALKPKYTSSILKNQCGIDGFLGQIFSY